MLIRTQHGLDLVNMDNVTSSCVEVFGDEIWIIAYTSDMRKFELGRYPTREQTIKVLNEIAEAYMWFQEADNANDRKISAVFNMPK